ncbi:MAG: hypothetical protein QOD09_53 [Bradyrhizobium sp.]|jgi:transposase|nr:hypothetical protein [Bradyrhizobium sp.]
MPKPCSNDLRERVVKAVEAGQPAVLQRFVLEFRRVQPSNGWRGGAGMAMFPGSSRGRIRSPLHPHRSWLLKLVAVQPDLTLTEVQQRLADRGVAIGIGSIWRFFDREGVSFKKNAVALRTGQARRRAQKGKLEKASGKG